VEASRDSLVLLDSTYYSIEALDGEAHLVMLKDAQGNTSQPVARAGGDRGRHALPSGHHYRVGRRPDALFESDNEGLRGQQRLVGQ
jgi:hypothetical protein